MKKSGNNAEQPISILLFGAVLGTVASTMVHTAKGKQLLHDAKNVFDDFVSLLEHTLDDDLSFEENVAGVRVFSDHVMDKLERVDAFNTVNRIQPMSVSPQPHVQSSAPAPRVPAQKIVHQQLREETHVSAFMYHQPVSMKKVADKKEVDDEVALLNRLGRQLYR